MDVKGAANAATGSANADHTDQRSSGETDSGDEGEGSNFSADEINHRLLQESRKNKERALKAEAKLRSIEEKSAQEQGKYKELYEKAVSQAESYKQVVFNQRIREEVRALASGAGCRNVDALLKIGDQDLLQYDDQTDTVHGVDLFVDDAKRKYPWAFQAVSNRSAVVNSQTPSGTTGTGTTKKLTAADIAKMPSGPEKTKVLMELYQKSAERH